MAVAYAYAEGSGKQPQELIELTLIDRFGVEAIKNRKYLNSKEVRSMLLTENVVNAYKSRKESENWAKWADDNREAQEMLEYARKQAEERGLIDVT
jgi:hypothetical protein